MALKIVKPENHQTGLVYVEYMLATLTLIVLLFMPVPGTEYSIVQFVIQGIREFYSNTTVLIALP